MIGIFMGNKSVVIFYILSNSVVMAHEVVFETTFNEQIPRLRAGVLSLFSFIPKVTNIISIFVSGIISDKFGYGPIWILAGILGVLNTYFIYKQSKYVWS